MTLAVALFSALFLPAFHLRGSVSADVSHSPILIFPGMTGSDLYVRDETNDFFCKTNDQFEKLWVDLVRILLCGQRELPLEWNLATDVYSDNAGVTIKTYDFGGLEGIPYLSDFVGYFVDVLGYERGKDIRGAPYDWRLAGDELEARGYFEEVRALVETMYENNGKHKVTLIGHSLGGPVSHYFLTRFSRVDQTWKDKYIHAYIPLAGAWSGANVALQALISGLGHMVPSLFLIVPYNPFLVKTLSLSTIIQSMESVYWLMPRASVWKDTVLVSTPSKSYTANNYEEMFNDLGISNSYKMYSHVLEMSPDYPAPNVSTHCYYGVGTDTVKGMVYDKDFSGAPLSGHYPTQIIGDGDMVVNVESSEMCLAWADMPSQYSFEYKRYPGVNHVDIITDSTVLSNIAMIVEASVFSD